MDALRGRELLIEQWGADEINCDPADCGGSGSPTRVKKIDAVRLQSAEHKKVEPTAEGLTALVIELQQEHIFD